jgi:hypothetical protein
MHSSIGRRITFRYKYLGGSPVRQMVAVSSGN